MNEILAAFDDIQTSWLSQISASKTQPLLLAELLADFSRTLGAALLDEAAVAEIFPVLERLAHAISQNEAGGNESGLTQILAQVQHAFVQSAKQALLPQQALELITAALPLFEQTQAWAVKLEMESYFNFITQELAQANLTLEQLDRSKSDFIAIAAHELKTPLTLIEGYAAMLRDLALSLGGRSMTPWQAESPGRCAETADATILLDGIHTGTQRLRQIVDDMIDVSLIDNSLLSLQFQPLWLDRLLHGLVQEIKPALEQRKLKLEILPFAGSQEMTFGDPQRLAQAFRNLLANAVKYTPDGGEIRIDGRKLPGFVEILVKDSGIGIPAEDKNRIFEKFGRLGDAALHSSSKTGFKGGGPGLGLPITKGIITAHGGAIWVESEGRDELHCPGSTFHVLLPLRKTPPDDHTGRLFHPQAGVEEKPDHTYS